MSNDERHFGGHSAYGCSLYRLHFHRDWIVAGTALGILAVVMLVVNLLGDVVNFITGTEPRAVIGIPIVAVLIAYLLRKRTKDHFNNAAI